MDVKEKFKEAYEWLKGGKGRAYEIHLSLDKQELFLVSKEYTGSIPTYKVHDGILLSEIEKILKEE